MTTTQQQTLDANVALLLSTAELIGEQLAAGDHRDLDGVSQAGLAGDLVAAAGLGSVAAAVLGKASRDSGDLRTSGFMSVKAFFRDGVGISGAGASQLQRLGTGVDRYPALKAGVLAGRFHPDAVLVAVRGIDYAVADLRGQARDEARARGEAIVVPVAEVGTVADVEEVCRSLIFHLDPEAAARRALEALERREVRFAQVGTQSRVTMVLDAVTGAAFKTVLDAEVDRRFREGSLPEELQPTGDEAEDERRARLARPRLYAEVFEALIRRLLDEQLVGTKHGEAPHVSLLVSEDIHAAGGPAQLLVPGQEPVTVANETAARILCDAKVTEIHVNGLVPDRTRIAPTSHTSLVKHQRSARDTAAGGHPDQLAPCTCQGGDGAGIDGGSGPRLVDLDGLMDPSEAHDLVGRCASVHCVGRESRTATKAQRKALAAGQQHCMFPGCRVDASRCEAHHVLPWERGGATCLSDLILLCSRHHHLVHEGRWRILADPGHPDGDPRHWVFRPPETGYLGRDGTLLAERLRRGHPPEPPPPGDPVAA
ncbi:MAG: HNH endonuclease [Actinobacteria bacterium]|nr:HNH endonuclease [Actinomycetota bacterium]